MESDVARFTARSVGFTLATSLFRSVANKLYLLVAHFIVALITSKDLRYVYKSEQQIFFTQPKTTFDTSYGTKFLRNFSRRLVSIRVNDNTRIIITKKRNSQSEPLQFVCYTIQIYRAAESELKRGRKYWCWKRSIHIHLRRFS